MLLEDHNYVCHPQNTHVQVQFISNIQIKIILTIITKVKAAHGEEARKETTRGLYTMSLLNTDNKVDLLIKTFVHRKINAKNCTFRPLLVVIFNSKFANNL